MDIAKFERIIDGSQVQLVHLHNQLMSCYITNYGARLVALNVAGFDGLDVDVVLGFDSIDGYLNANEKYHGATIGRYANRIANGTFSLDGTSYILEANNGPNSLHGGSDGFHTKVWSIEKRTESEVTMRYISSHMEEGFPGRLTVDVTYALRGTDLVITYKATSDQATVINLTHHSYFNLNGEGDGTVLRHQLQINADSYTPVNSTVIPDGRIVQVATTPFDFRISKAIGTDIDQEDEQLRIGSGYDHNFVVSAEEGSELSHVATAIGDQSEIIMDVWSTEPGVQLYTGNHLNGHDIGKNRKAHKRREAFCLETQHYPDAPNQEFFPSTLLEAGEVFESQTEYRFSLK